MYTFTVHSPTAHPGGSRHITEKQVSGLQPGAYGPYELIRILGEGGGGQVWEADDSRSGRRVALKVMTQLRAESPKALLRFEQEGRLAASITHPSCVFIFGAEEVDGQPTISMELMRGGTLRDRLNDGPLEYRDAVASVLDIIEGLEAAQRAGIIHRDVKPSNCFLEEGGVGTKIGDFGVSRTLETPSDLTVTGSFIGTPSYSSPEQVRGEELDFRSDMYSVGATLYELLTDRVPFEGVAMAAAARILTETPAPPSSVNPAVPKRLDRIVLRLMSKDPAKRFPSYEALRKALTPFTPGVLSAGGIGRRVVANVFDQIALAPLGVVFAPFVIDQRGWLVLAALVAGSAVEFLYFWVMEAAWGASLGKRLLGLTVSSASGERLSAGSLGLRTCLFVGASSTPMMLILALGPVTETAASILPAIGALALFLTMRPKNGFAGIHDLVTDSRVVLISRTSRVGAPDRPLEASEPVEPAPSHLGPYTVESAVWRGPRERLLLARDADLDRRVWIHHYDDPEAGPALDRLTRTTPGRLRWLQGSRAEGSSWDAYAIPNGSPLSNWVRAEGRLSWAESRQVLRGVAVELAHPDAEAPSTLSPSRVWVDGTGEPKLLDFEANPTDRGGPTLDPSTTAPADFLRWLAVFTLEGRDDQGPSERPNGPRAPVPGHAHEFLQELFAEDPPVAEAVADRLSDLMTEPPAVTRARRGMAVLVGALLPLCVFIIMLVIVASLYSTSSGMDIVRPTAFIKQVQRPDTAADGPSPRREAAEVLLMNLEATLGEGPVVRSFLTGLLSSTDMTREDLTALVDSLAATRPPPTPQEVQEARRIWVLGLGRANRFFTRFFLRLTAVAGLVAVVLALLVKGGPVLLATGIQVRTADGTHAGGVRSAARTALAWSPFLISTSVIILVPDGWESTALAFSLVLFLAWLVGLGLTLATPEQGPHDRVAGTYLMPK